MALTQGDRLTSSKLSSNVSNSSGSWRPNRCRLVADSVEMGPRKESLGRIDLKGTDFPGRDKMLS